jgi:hypothetical protein
MLTNQEAKNTMTTGQIQKILRHTRATTTELYLREITLDQGERGVERGTDVDTGLQGDTGKQVTT